VNTVTANGNGTHPYANLDAVLAAFLAGLDALDEITRRRVLVSVVALLEAIERAA
jgi:hypothetical protein